MANCKMAFFSLLLLSFVVNSSFSARIVGFWTAGGSQYINMRQTLEELASRGHEVNNTVLTFFTAPSISFLIAVSPGSNKFNFFTLTFKRSVY